MCGLSVTEGEEGRRKRDWKRLEIGEKIHKAKWFELRGGILVLSNSIDVGLAADLASRVSLEVKVFDSLGEVDQTAKRLGPKVVRERQTGM